jgi:asparagine synthase (glutamine-hydrolysing)
MCGICGVFSFSGPDLLDPLPDMVELMVRRGPDDEGLWSDHVRCAFGFRRLSVQDLSPTGHQPMPSDDGRYVIVFNGEVYNFRELRSELQSQGVRFRSSGDTEVVLYALVRWGRQALERFNGMFALAFYDTLEKRLLLARDHAGIKPLYVLNTSQGLVFASQYDQILAHPLSRACAVNGDALGLYLRLGYIPAPYALLKGSQMLPAGAWMEIDALGAIHEGRHFEFLGWREPDLRGDAAVEALDEAITASVKSQLVSDVPVGTFLSGGIDSPLVAAKIHALGREDVKAFTIGTAGHATDESADASIYAKEIGITQVIEHITPEQSLTMLHEVVEACGEPFGDFSMFPTLLVSRLARREVTVMLSGDGGDELFWGYAKRFADVVARSPDFAQPLLLRKMRWGMKRHLGIGNAYPQLTWPTIGDWYRSKQSHLHEDWLCEVFPEGPFWPDDCNLFQYAGHDRSETAQWARHNEFVGRMSMILLKVDRASMHESLEVRVPLLDRRVIEVASRTDWQSCLDLDQRVGKLPLRRLLSRHVKHQTQAKRGFTVPMGVWLRGPLREVFEAEVLSRTEFLGYPINQRALRRRFAEFLSGSSDEAWGFWLLLSLALWEKQHYRKFRY